MYTPTYGDCLELCSRFAGDGEGCFGVHWTVDGGHCWLRNSNVSTSDLKPDTGSVSALVNRNQMKGFDTACTDEDYQKLTGVDGIAYTTNCNQVYQGEIQCFDEDEYPCLDPARYFYHAESLEECLGFCVALHPRCRIVSWNPGLQVGFANCWPRFGNQNPKLGQPSSQQGTMHSAAIIEAPTPDSACPQDNVYHSGGQANGTQFDIHCGKLNQGLNITSLQAQNITYCMDACAANKDGCTAVLYSSSLSASAPLNTSGQSRASSEDTLEPANDSSQQQWWNAAVRTSKVIELPQLAQFACDGHLVAFMAINLFNAAIVMVVLSLSDPLTNRAQEAKRAIARIYRLQATLGARSTLSKQSSSILRSLVNLMMRRESEAILAPVVPNSAGFDQASGIHQSSTGTQALSVRETMSMPLGAQMSASGHNPQSWDANASHLASRLDDSLASVQKGNCSLYVYGHGKADLERQQSPYSQMQSIQ